MQIENKKTIPNSEHSQNKKASAILIEVDYVVKEGAPIVRLLLKGRRFFRLYDPNFEPYFYLDAPQSEIPEIMKLHVQSQGLEARVVRVEECKVNLYGKEKRLLKVFCNLPRAVPILRERLKSYPSYEYNIPYAKRYLIDKGLSYFARIYYLRKKNEIVKIIKSKDDEGFKLNTLAFDIETYNPQGNPRPKNDPIIMISYATRNKARVLTFKKIDSDFVEVKKSEEEVISSFCKILDQEDIELLVGYNSSVFDIPYLAERSRELGIELALGRDKSSYKRRVFGMRTLAKISGRIHLDLYHIIRFMGIIGALRLPKYSLEDAYREITGRESRTKSLVKKLDIYRLWDGSEKDRELLAEYSKNDALETLELAEKLLPMQIEMSKITKLSLFEVVSSTAGQLVESLLMYRSAKHNAIIPDKPSQESAKKREQNPIQGAFVKIPTPGIYENIAVFDFRGLYPSIICSHNIDPFTLLPPHSSEDAYMSPLGHKFSKKKKGLIPQVLEEIINMRVEIKQKLKSLRPNTDSYHYLFAKSQALKILANSYYGYLAYAKSRWYSRECAESVTAWGRQYIQETIKKAQDAGFDVLYGDTDSIFLLLGKKSKKDALEFMDKINKSLPGNMELELEGFFPRGLFVTKKVSKDARGAKKKYALIDEQGRIKIRGFELVRRDWSKIAKDTQKAVLSAILMDGSKEKAVKIVRDTIDRLYQGKVPIEELIIFTQLQKDPASYEVISPELAAARKAIEQGIKLEKGSVIGYVITKHGSSISDKAKLAEFARDYDANYYITRQILPAVMKILAELGYTDDDLKFKGNQSSLTGFLS
ncbi:MAG: DNA-directed DNA polymerase [Candidatus Anstonellales archaeon]